MTTLCISHSSTCWQW